jgi:hypothetical protein
VRTAVDDLPGREHLPAAGTLVAGSEGGGALVGFNVEEAARPGMAELELGVGDENAAAARADLPILRVG